MTTKAEREYLAAVWAGFLVDVRRQLQARQWSPRRINAALAELTEKECGDETPAQTAARLQKASSAIQTQPIKWHGYGEGALPASQVASYNPATLEAITHDGRRFNCHPKVTACGGPAWDMTLIECPEGAYPIRWEERT